MFSKIKQRAASAVIRYFFNRNPNVFPADVIASLFHRHYYYQPDTLPKNTFLGVTIVQSPLDMYLYQQVAFDVRPGVIIQTGVAHGGSALYFATLLDLIGADPECIYVGVDLKLSESARRLTHRRIRLIEGSSTAPEVLSQVASLVGDRKGMVSLDSDHSKSHVTNELKAYKEYVGVGSYLVVEDTNIGRHTVCQGFGPGPREAVDDFLAENDEFEADNALWQRNVISHHEYGWLKRTRGTNGR